MIKKNYLKITEITQILNAMDNEQLDCDDREAIKVCLVYNYCYDNPHGIINDEGLYDESKGFTLFDFYGFYNDIVENTDYFDDVKYIKNINSLEKCIEDKFGVKGLVADFLYSIKSKVSDLEESLKNGDLTAQIGELINASK